MRQTLDSIMATERLQKLIAQAGLASRRAAETLITDGRVRVNGQVVRELGAKADTGADRIEVAGHGVISPEPHVYIALYKPDRVISAVRDPHGRPTVVSLLNRTRAVGRRSHEGNLPRVFPVGRLDFNAEGILLLTNDGSLANRLLHPRGHVPKTYMVKVKGHPCDKALGRLRRGLRLRPVDGKPGALTRRTTPAEATVIKAAAANSWIELTIFEGWNHQVKRMCDAVGHPVLRLVRTHFAGIGLDELPPGAFRFLAGAEVKALKAWKPRT